MSDSLKHAERVVIAQNGQDTHITMETYTERLKTVTERTSQKINSQDATILADFVKCLGLFTDHTSDELEVSLKRLPNGTIRIVKTWTVEKQQY